ncbi:NAD(P)H-dependent oxidoreductase [Algoriphagus pacificus]|uniref:NAD(P)H-dependent oxidoreductase n=1 Tax=Algoriphagus pacificus TaxID=2811234 RepID=A0ABS3CE87_9BACT|nr:NAD(P)H-dependent oxidoreductase [Algoriphagus pacificus]MBN7815342.1 NAD(P)H-dependent oxidoreductase [Algoriphagus pacificus]
MKLIETLNWRYATKKFDSKKKINSTHLELLKEAVRLSVSSYGLQLYKVLIIEDPKKKKLLRKASWDQSQITDASHLFVFCSYNQNFNEGVDSYINLLQEGVEESKKAGILAYGKSIKKSISAMGEGERQSWSEKQCYLAMNNLLIAAAELKLDACPMEGFEPDKYDEILGLNDQGLHAVLVAPIGFRALDDSTHFRKKVRRSSEELFELI